MNDCDIAVVLYGIVVGAVGALAVVKLLTEWVL